MVRALGPDGSIKFPDVVQNLLARSPEGAGGLHFAGDQRSAVEQRLGDVRPLPLGDIAGEGGVPPAGTAGQVPGLDGAGVHLPPVIGQHLRVVGDEDLLGSPAVEELGRLCPVGAAGEDLRLRRVGLQVVDAGQILLLLHPVVKPHGPVRLHMAQKALYVHRHLAPPGRLGKQGPVKVPVHQAGEVVNGGVDGRQVLPGEGVAHPQGGAGPLLLVGGKILVADGTGGLGWSPEHLGPRAGKGLLQVHIRRVQLGKYGGAVPAAGGGEAGGHHRAPYLPALVSLTVDVVVQGHGADDQHIIFRHGTHLLLW